MFIGAAQVHLELPWGGSLKAKRSVLRPILSKLKDRFELHAAEVGAMDDHGEAIVGLVACGNAAQVVNARLSKALDWLEHHQFEAVVASIELEIIPWSGEAEGSLWAAEGGEEEEVP